MGSGHASETGSFDGLKVLGSAGIHGNRRFKACDDGKRVDKVGAAVQVWRRSWTLAKA